MPGRVNRPSARVPAAYVVPDGPCTATTRAPSSGVPRESVTIPEIAPVVTPWARAAPAESIEKTAAATRAHDERTIQRMDGPLIRRDGRGVQVPIETRRKWSARGTASRMLGGGFLQQIHRGHADKKVREPGRERRRQHAA